MPMKKLSFIAWSMLIGLEFSGIAFADVSLESPCQNGKLLASDDFKHGLKQWSLELQDKSSNASVADGILDVVAPAGATLWFKPKLSGDYSIEFTAAPLPFVTEKGEQRISDLNMFWNARSGQGGEPYMLGFDGALASYNPLSLYYVGFGANYNTSTRLRRYDGSQQRPQITGYATAESLTPEDKAGAMTAATSLMANQPVRVRIISRKPTPNQPQNLLWYANDKLIFSYADPHAYLDGWFGLRTTLSHFQFQDFRVSRCAPVAK